VFGSSIYYYIFCASELKRANFALFLDFLCSGPAPAEAYDPEADDLERGGWAGRGGDDSSDDGDLGMEEEAAQPEIQAKEKKLRMRADIAVDAKEYAGKAVARKQLREEEEEGDVDVDDDEEDDEDEDEDVSEEDMEDDEQEKSEGEDDENFADAEARRIEEEQDEALMRMVAASKADTGKSMHARNQRDIAGQSWHACAMCLSNCEIAHA
jgi:hypothetical protein